MHTKTSTPKVKARSLKKEVQVHAHRYQDMEGHPGCKPPYGETLLASVPALLHDLANAEVHLEPWSSGQNLQGQERGDLNQVHGQERHRVIAAEDGVGARGHLRQAQLEAILGLPEPSHQEELIHDPISEGAHRVQTALWIRG